MREEDGHCGSALLPLWPTAIGYAVSYLFIAIIWTNHTTSWGSWVLRRCD
jgi:uncharacterized membrane protein